MKAIHPPPRAQNRSLTIAISIAAFYGAAVAEVQFPGNPNSYEECEAPYNAVRDLAREEEVKQKAVWGQWENLGHQSRVNCNNYIGSRNYERCVYPYDQRRAQLQDLSRAHFLERDRLYREANRLKSNCERMVSANKQQQERQQQAVLENQRRQHEANQLQRAESERQQRAESERRQQLAQQQEQEQARQRAAYQANQNQQHAAQLETQRRQYEAEQNRQRVIGTLAANAYNPATRNQPQSVAVPDTTAQQNYLDQQARQSGARAGEQNQPRVIGQTPQSNFDPSSRNQPRAVQTPESVAAAQAAAIAAQEQQKRDEAQALRDTLRSAGDSIRQSNNPGGTAPARGATTAETNVAINAARGGSPVAGAIGAGSLAAVGAQNAQTTGSIGRLGYEIAAVNSSDTTARQQTQAPSFNSGSAGPIAPATTAQPTPAAAKNGTQVASLTPAAPAVPSAPKDACAKRMLFAYANCMAQQCKKDEFKDHKQCQSNQAANE